MTETFIKERKHTLTGKVQKVGIDDASAFLARFAERLAGHLRSHPLCPRTQGPLHLEINGKSASLGVGSHDLTGCNISITGTRAHCADGARFMLAIASIRT